MNLTIDQKQIVDKLISEFTKLNNKPKDGEFILLNYNALNVEKERQISEEKALDAHNQSMRALIGEVAKDVAKKINIDIQKGNLPLKVVYTSDTVTIQHIKSVGYDNEDVRIYIRQVTKSVEFGSKIVNYIFGKSYCDDIRYNTIEDIINSDFVQNGLIKLIKKSK